MLVFIEQRMCIDDCKVWVWYLENSGKEVILVQFIVWMNIEMKFRMRVMVVLRSIGLLIRYFVGYFGFDINVLKLGFLYKCWICKNLSYWIDQCQKFVLLNLEDRIKVVKENYVCFSCLKCVGRDYRFSNCFRRCQCFEKSNGIQCFYYYYFFLYRVIQLIIVIVMLVINNQKVLLFIV